MAHRIPSQAFRLPINRFLSSSTTHASSINSLRRGLNRPQIPNASAPAMPVDLFGHHDLMVRASKTVEGQELGRRWLGSSAANRIDSDRVCSFYTPVPPLRVLNLFRYNQPRRKRLSDYYTRSHRSTRWNDTFASFPQPPPLLSSKWAGRFCQMISNRSP